MKLTCDGAFVCKNCVDEPGLQRLIAETATEFDCNFCGNHSDTKPIAAPFDAVAERPGSVALPFCFVCLKGQEPLPGAYPRELRTLGDRLRKRRLDLGLRQKDVAGLLEVDEMTV